MNDIDDRIQSLSPKQRETLLKRLRDKQVSGSQWSEDLPIIRPRPEDHNLPFPLTYIQQAYWIGRNGCFDFSNCGTNVYMEYELSGVGVDVVQRLNGALSRLIERHDMLRAVILPEGEQIVLPQAPKYEIQVKDLRAEVPACINAELESVRERMQAEKGAIDRWPLFDFQAHLINDQLIRLHIRIDALLIDGTSRFILLKDLSEFLASPSLSLPPIECSYRDYALMWTGLVNSNLYQRSRDYWLRRVPTLPPGPQLPFARKLDPLTPLRSVSQFAEILEPTAWSGLKARAAQVGLTPSVLVFAAFAEALSAHSTSTRFTIALIGANRPPIHPHINRLIGNFNTIYILVVEDLPVAFEDRAKQMQQQLTLALDHRYFSGFEVLREMNRIRRNFSKATIPVLFNSVLEYSHPSYGIRESSDLQKRHELPGQLAEVEAGVHVPQVLLKPIVSETTDGALVCKWQSVEEAFPDGFMSELFASYQQILRRLAYEEGSWREPARKSADTERRKTNEDTLPCGENDRTRPQVASIAPRDTLEFQLAQLWQDLLRTDSFGVRDDFIDLGGDSFLTVRLMIRIKKAYGKEISLTHFLQKATIEHLASLIRKEGSATV
jgi:pyochelin synthetase